MSRRTLKAAASLLVALGAALFDSAAVPDTSPPSGISPATMSLTDVLLKNRTAVGSLRSGTPPTRDERWTVTAGSLAGTLHYVESGSDWRQDETLGPSTTADGTSGGRHWRMNSNGQVAFGNDIHQQSAVDAMALRNPAHPGVTLLGRTASPVDAYVVKVDPPGGRLEYLFFDAKTFLVDRAERIVAGRRVTTTYENYQATNNVVEAWHVRVNDGLPNNDVDRVMQSLTIGTPVAAEAVAIPTNAPPIMAPPPAPTSVPAEIDADQIVVQTTMGGHKVDFLMDSGAGGIVIDKNVVEALGIKEYGKYTGETAGTYTSSEVILPKISIGSLTLENVHADSLPFFQMSTSGRPIAGLLGYDFIADAVWHVDYAHGTLEVIPAATFSPPAWARPIDVSFYDFVPTVTATLAGLTVPTFIVDTGADRSVIFSRYREAHSAQLTDRGLGEAIEAANPFVSKMSGVGGRIEYRPLQAGPLVFGPWTFPKWLFYVTQNAAAFEFEDYDGLIGQDMLRNFDVYLDYPHSKIYLVPNDRFRQRWGT